ncbi:GDCCVxC domain-containing (seleno)protein [Bradyrhizobium sp. Ce-3]|uniref:GDCCVxC domain-containing (seleno)protein n=1 Tax=Bradyrhizobium sp. Ce-3 TaxID=2913970 RepID=UPI001FC7CB4D|nr:GDCCVxC domain-containing (seleno)protein [Bradyrhizobium sp. Ce-3]
MTERQLTSELTCPRCGHVSVETMPTDACQFFYDCKGCGTRLKPKPGDCCVYCSYGTVRCPPMQAGDCCGSTAPANRTPVNE